MYLMRHAVCLFIVLPTSQGFMHWEISNAPIIYGNDIILTCETGKTLKNDSSCPVRQWFSGPQYKQLLYNVFPSVKSKYEDRTDLSTTHFSLVIKNCTVEDLNINYTCSCGFESYTKNLSINEDNFVVLPEKKSVVTHQNNVTLSVKMELRRVYPQPKCHFAIGDQRQSNTFNSVKELQSVRNGIFYDSIFEQDFLLNVEDCNKNLEIVCVVGKEQTIAIEEIEIHNCTGLDKQGGNGNKTIPEGEKGKDEIYSEETTIILAVVIVAVILAAGGVVTYITIFRKRRNITKTLIADDVKFQHEAKIKHQSVDSCDSGISLLMEIQEETQTNA